MLNLSHLPAGCSSMQCRLVFSIAASSAMDECSEAGTRHSAVHLCAATLLPGICKGTGLSAMISHSDTQSRIVVHPPLFS
jgi:hypothetical protein